MFVTSLFQKIQTYPYFRNIIFALIPIFQKTFLPTSNTNNDNIGMFGNWNRCIELSHGNWLVILSDDDELEDDYIETMMSYATGIKDCKALCCRHHLIDDNDDIIKRKEIHCNQSKVIPISMNDMYILHPVDIMGCLLNRSEAMRVGGFNEAFFPCSDNVFLLHICAENGLYLNTNKAIRYRWAVNESIKPSVRIDFAKFHIQKSSEINKIFGLHGRIIHRFIVNAKCDYEFFPLIREKIIDQETNNSLRTELGLDKKYSPFRRFFYRIISRFYAHRIYCRKNVLG